ncbi:6-carboxytetrahydropterin synthase QueD [Paenibacillus rhizovicinus]|uniref:6-carboxy-5,6,7,8-tetrahydropterin synthase n=1 Tax=Paenibacillus rhizovicinus TaxID=2704463 RepID=A0A6C0P7A6_9BACL|nr:6-carboxytetrahydropterin synthase QueD [Paenibacillus rhizovicinus]QHW34265.1 6-carboxytetrahydropterin synthase QueD [Paenibacillus rhizovicinus]
MIFQYYPTVSHSFTYELNKDLHFAAAHFIPSSLAGKCQDLHGHTYVVNVTVCGDALDESGFLVNFASIKELIHKRYDHTSLNEHEEFSGADSERFPTTEVLAAAIYAKVQAYLDGCANQPRCMQIIVRETPTSYVIYRPKMQEIM